jgi:hypothetical protein
MKAKNTTQSYQETRPREQADLERQYGNIGISAVAAAVRYEGGKNPAYAPDASRDEDESQAAA